MVSRGALGPDAGLAPRRRAPSTRCCAASGPSSSTGTTSASRCRWPRRRALAASRCCSTPGRGSPACRELVGLVDVLLASAGLPTRRRVARCPTCWPSARPGWPAARGLARCAGLAPTGRRAASRCRPRRSSTPSVPATCCTAPCSPRWPGTAPSTCRGRSSGPLRWRAGRSGRREPAAGPPGSAGGRDPHQHRRERAQGARRRRRRAAGALGRLEEGADRRLPATRCGRRRTGRTGRPRRWPRRARPRGGGRRRSSVPWRASPGGAPRTVEAAVVRARRSQGRRCSGCGPCRAGTTGRPCSPT